MKLLSCVQLFVTPRTVAHQAPLSMGMSRWESWSGWPPSSRGSSQPRDQTWVSCTSRQTLFGWATREAWFKHEFVQIWAWTLAFTERPRIPVAGSQRGRPGGDVSGRGGGPASQRQQLVYFHQASPPSASQSLSVLQPATRRVNGAPPFQLFRGNQPAVCVVLPSWSSPLKISILRRKRVNVTLMCRRQIPDLRNELRTVRAPLRAGGWPHVCASGLFPMKSHKKFLRGWHCFRSLIGREGFISQHYVITGCWQALLRDTWETLIETFLFGNSRLFPWFDNTNQMQSGPAKEACPGGSSETLTHLPPAPDSLANLLPAPFPFSHLWSGTTIGALITSWCENEQLKKFAKVWVL